MMLEEAPSEDFAILCINVPPTPSFPQSAVHEVRIRRNVPKVPTPNDDRSLFLKNVPVDSTEAHFRAIFSQLVGAGRFESIVFDDEKRAVFSAEPAQASSLANLVRKRKRNEDEEAQRADEDEALQLPSIWNRRLHKSSATAVALLADEKSVQLVLKAIDKSHKKGNYPVWGEGLPDDLPPLGSPWIINHLRSCRIDKSATQKAVHAFFNAFNRREKEAQELAKKLRNEPDEDGFVTVTRGGRAAPASRTDAEEAKQKMLDRQAKKDSDLKDFYRFQLRERRKHKQAALLRRFAEDKRKIDALREKKGKFKPQV